MGKNGDVTPGTVKRSSGEGDGLTQLQIPLEYLAKTNDIKGRLAAAGALNGESLPGFNGLRQVQGAFLRNQQLRAGCGQDSDPNRRPGPHRAPPELYVATTVRSVETFLARSSGM